MKKRDLFWIYVIGFVILGVSFLVDAPVIANLDSIKHPILDFGFGAVEHIGSVIIILIVMTTLFLWEEKKRECVSPFG